MDVKKVIRTENTLFKNSQCLFVEYSDILKTPFFLLMRALQQADNFKKVFDISKIEKMSIGELYIWYIHRNNFNPLRDFKVIADVENYDDGFYDYIFRENLASSDIFYNENTELIFSNILKNVLKENDSNFIHKVIIYDEFGNEFTKRDVETNYVSDKIRVEFRLGDFKDAIHDIPRDSSYIISDINRIKSLDEMNKLEYSSLLLPYEFDYNIDKNLERYKVDIEELAKTKTFKINFFKNMVLEV